MEIQIVDSKLPTLSTLFDHAAVTTGFVMNLPATRHVGRQQYLHYDPGHSCVATYELWLEDPHLPPQPTIGVVTCTPGGVTYRLYAADPDLPGLASAAAVGAISSHLRSLNIGADEQDPVPNQEDEWTATPIRYRPGNRCSLRYTRHTPTQQQEFFGKLFRHADERRIAAMYTCYQKAQECSQLPLLPQPLAYWPELQMVVQPLVNGVEFHAHAFDEQIPSARRTAWLCWMGQTVGAFHELSRLNLPHVTWQEDLAALHAYLPAITQVMPALAAAYQEALAAIPTMAAALPATDVVVSHGALRTDQFLMAPSPADDPNGTEPPRLILIDLDTLCLADPARDLGNCLAYLTWKAIRQPQHATFIAKAQCALLAGYTAQRAAPDDRRLSVYTALALLKIAGRRFRNLTYREWALVPGLIERAYTVVTSGGRNVHEAYLFS